MINVISRIKGINTVNTPMIGKQIVGHESNTIHTKANAPAPWNNTWKALICLALVYVPSTTTVSCANNKNTEIAAEIIIYSCNDINSLDWVEIDLPADITMYSY